MDRNQMLSNISDPEFLWDFAIIGGGASGVGAALEASSRGYKTLLIEQFDFAKGTSSRSTKLAHGGVRYLQQGNIALVLEALKERGIMKRNAPHLVHDMPFIVPVYDWWEGPFYGIGLKLYDALAGKEGLGPSKLLSKDETLKHIPTLETEGLLGGVIYYDGQFNDSRFIINMAQTAAEQGATLINYMKAERLVKDHGMISGLICIDQESQKKHKIKASVVINATGVFTDHIRKMDDPMVDDLMTSSQGIHIVLDRSFLPGDSGIMVPHTDDGRVFFIIPWQNKILVGTTESPVNEFLAEPIPMQEEIDFLLKHTSRYLVKDPSQKDILSVFAGLRPLVKEGKDSRTAEISREHIVHISRSGLVTITGGKWTTYRKMAEDVIDKGLMIAHLKPKPSITKTLLIHGYHNHSDQFGSLQMYGSDALEIKAIWKEDASYKTQLHPMFQTTRAEVIWAVRQEMARTVEDFLARRSRILLLDARAAVEMAAEVAKIMAAELGQKRAWIKSQIEEFENLAGHYMIREK